MSFKELFEVLRLFNLGSKPTIYNALKDPQQIFFEHCTKKRNIKENDDLHIIRLNGIKSVAKKLNVLYLQHKTCLDLNEIKPKLGYIRALLTNIGTTRSEEKNGKIIANATIGSLINRSRSTIKRYDKKSNTKKKKNWKVYRSEDNKDQKIVFKQLPNTRFSVFPYRPYGKAKRFNMCWSLASVKPLQFLQMLRGTIYFQSYKRFSKIKNKLQKAGLGFKQTPLIKTSFNDPSLPIWCIRSILSSKGASFFDIEGTVLVH